MSRPVTASPKRETKRAPKHEQEEKEKEKLEPCGAETRAGTPCARKGVCPYHQKVVRDTPDEAKGKLLFVSVEHWADLWCLAKRLQLSYAPDEILFSFDYDGTLNARALTAHTKGKTQKEKLAEYHDTNKQARDFLAYLNEAGIPWFVNTAAENPSRPSEEMKMDAAEFGKVRKECSPYWTPLPRNATYEDAESGVVTKRDGCVLSSGYDKDATILQARKALRLPTKVTVHVDDGEINLYTLAANAELTRSQLTVLAHFPLVPGSFFGSEPSATPSGEPAIEWLQKHVPLLDLYPTIDATART
jgi:hypothetical protein